MRKKKIPRKAVEPLMRHCESLSEGSEKTAAEIFKEFLGLMNKYADYFFSEPWPKKFDFEKATTFTDEDIEFLTEGKKEEFMERFTTMLLKKNINLESGFLEVFGPFWTEQAFREKFVRPSYKPVQKAFGDLSEGDKDPRSIVNGLKEKFDIWLIHDGLVDLVEHKYLDKVAGRLLASILDLLHKVEELPPCHQYRCELERERLYTSREEEGCRDNS